MSSGDAGAEMDLASLSESQQLALQQFTSVTDQQLSDAIPLLHRSQWNVQIAIAKFFDGETADPVAEARASLDTLSPPAHSTHRETLLNGSSSFSSSASSTHRDIDPAPRIVPQPESQVSQRPPFVLALLLTPFNLVYRLFVSSLGLFTFLFPFLPRWLSTRTSNSQGRTTSTRNTIGRRPLNPRDAAARFIREFDEEYGNGSLPFLEDGYAQGLDMAKNDLKFLLVLLFSPEHDDTSSFTRQTLLAPEVVAYIADPKNNIIVWAGNVKDSEAYQVSTALDCTKFPFAALISRAPVASSTAMSVVTRIVGPMPPRAFVTKLKDAISENSGVLDTIRSLRTARQSERNLREEQNSAYERSLAQDRERTRRRNEAEAEKARAERAALERAEVDARNAQNLLNWKMWRARSLPVEPSADAKNASRVSVRMQSGERIVRRFDPDVPMENLYAFVECYDLLRPDKDFSTSNVEEPTDFEHQYGFQLVAPMPRIVYKLEDGGRVGDRIGPSGNLIVESIEHDEDDEA